MASTAVAPGRTGSGATAPEDAPAFPARVVAWFRAHQQVSTYAAGAIVLAGALFAWNLLSTRRSEAVARDQLLQARSAFESKNWALAASELARMTENYSGTQAAQEGMLLLAQVRMMQGQHQQAVAVLADFAPGASKNYRAQAFGLLGAAYENVVRPREAALAYQSGAEVADLPFMKAQLLADAGRAFVAAGDTAQGLAAYRRIVKELDKTPTAAEARVRIGELSRGTVVP